MGGRRMIPRIVGQRSGTRQGWTHWIFFGIWAIALLVVAPRLLSPFDLNLLRKFLAYAIVALGLDLIWGHSGMLSLGHRLFFSLGAYCVALYSQLEQSVGRLPKFMGLYGGTTLLALC